MYIDFHNHIDFYKDEEIDSVINCINLNKIMTIACSMDEESYLNNIEISKKSDYIVPIFGIHPWRVKNKTRFSLGRRKIYISVSNKSI